MKRDFEIPTQVRWYDEENEMFHGGIAFGDVIICGCCGGIIELDEIDLDKLTTYDFWVNLDEEICGDDMEEEE